MNDDARINSLLDQGLRQFELAALASPFLDYLSLLNKWNLAYNLTAIRDPFEMISKHILDSLAVLTWIKGPRILDVGTGAGLPGIPLAIARPDMHFVLLDSNGKKIRFLKEVKRQLHLNNVDVVQFRVENYHLASGFDTVISRAFSSIEQMIHWTHHLLAQDGLWLAMKGRSPEAELLSIPHPYQVHRYHVDGIEGERCCVLINNNNKE